MRYKSLLNLLFLVAVPAFGATTNKTILELTTTNAAPGTGLVVVESAGTRAMTLDHLLASMMNLSGWVQVTNGLDGTNGVDGAVGPEGPAGPTGATGESGAVSPPVGTYTAAPVDLTNRVLTVTLTGDLNLTHTTNRTAGVAQYTSLFIQGDAQDRALTLNTNWVLWGCTATNTIRSNAWSVIHLMNLGGTGETDIHVRFDQQ